MSKFQEILRARQGAEAAIEPAPAAISRTQVPKLSRTQNSEKPKGRPPAKRSDPEYLQVTAYIRRETHLKAKIRLLRDGKGKEFSELVEELLNGWLG